MQENLKLGSTSAIDLTSADTDLSAGTNSWTLPASSDTTWENMQNGMKIAQFRVGKTSIEGWKSDFGNYYSWCAATAGTCAEATTKNMNASGSICPKNWHLPSSGSSDSTDANVGQNSEFYKLFGADGANLGSDYSIRFNAVQVSPYLFPAAGYIIYNNLAGAGSNGFYWSSTSRTYDDAYGLHFTSGSFLPLYSGSTYARGFGYSVRCVTNY